MAQQITLKKVYIGMSGGVDSSVSAALLKKQGYDVTGVFIKVWQPDEEITGLKCTWREDRLDAMRVAAQLGIKFATLDLEKEYKQNVVDYMISEYRLGRTPNPDVMCNKYVKFGGFFKWAMGQGADYVATGHYAQSKNGDLIAGDDINKDQSYFLWTLTKEQLSKTLFPVGDIEKPEVRKLAKKFKLPTAEKKDSQGLCFIGKIDVKEFLAHYIEPKKGDVLDINGKVIGWHDGAALFTNGERHGFFINDKSKTPNDEPLYVSGKNMEKNTITVSTKINAENAEKKAINLTDVNWTRGRAPGTSAASANPLTARPRYRAPLVSITVSDFNAAKNTCTVTFEKAQDALSPGQSLVIYAGTTCLGGGIIS